MLVSISSLYKSQEYFFVLFDAVTNAIDFILIFGAFVLLFTARSK